MRPYLFAAFVLALGYAQFRESGLPGLSAELDLRVTAAGSKQPLPARVYLLKNGRPFRLSPVDSLLPLRVDLFYRDRLWIRQTQPKTLEVVCNDQSHFILLDGAATFTLPAGRYRVEAYRGLLFRPASAEFELRPGETTRVALELAPVKGREQWLSGDDHIHLTRAPSENDVFLRWLSAEDLSVGNFLQLQRQMDAAVQYAFGSAGEARLPGYTIRPGQESRSEYYGHINLLGIRELLRPVSIGPVYGNSADAWPFPSVLFERGRQLGATVGYAHFDGGVKHSTQLMDLALGKADFVEVFQFGVLKTELWYRWLNAGLRVTGIAGSDFPVPLNNRKPWPHSMPLLGPERTLVKARPGPLYETWAEGVRRGEVVVSNGPLLDLSVNGRGPGATIRWSGDSLAVEGAATAVFHRPIERLEIVVNGEIAATRAGDGAAVELTLPFRVSLKQSSWLAARASAARIEGEPEIRAHTNPVYLLRDGRAVSIAADRKAVLQLWQEQIAYYKDPALPFAAEDRRRELLDALERASKALSELAPAGENW